MHDRRFDRLTQAIAASTSRREVIGLLAAMAAVRFRPQRAVAAHDEAVCEPGLTSCAGEDACVDLRSDLNHCGACGSICESGLAPVACRAGECVRANCPVGVEYCGVVDGCRDLSSDRAHCGACGNFCVQGSCVGGVCAPSNAGCSRGEIECGGMCVATCCNNDHCGACGTACTLPFTCFEGICDCPSGDCPPLTLPNTGTSGVGDDSARSAWSALVAAGAATMAAIGVRRAGAPANDSVGGRR